MRPKDLALVIGFDRSVTLVQDYTDSPRLLSRAIDELEIGGGTSLYDAIYLASKELSPRSWTKGDHLDQ
jgi:Mg-chelatase subunit ChlD